MIFVYYVLRYFYVVILTRVLLLHHFVSTVSDPVIRKRRKKSGGNKKRNYTEGWVEFTSRRAAKMVAAMLNNRPIGALRKRVIVNNAIYPHHIIMEE